MCGRRGCGGGRGKHTSARQGCAAHRCPLTSRGAVWRWGSRLLVKFRWGGGGVGGSPDPKGPASFWERPQDSAAGECVRTTDERSPAHACSPKSGPGTGRPSAPGLCQDSPCSAPWVRSAPGARVNLCACVHAAWCGCSRGGCPLHPLWLRVLPGGQANPAHPIPTLGLVCPHSTNATADTTMTHRMVPWSTWHPRAQPQVVPGRAGRAVCRAVVWRAERTLAHSSDITGCPGGRGGCPGSVFL